MDQESYLHAGCLPEEFQLRDPSKLVRAEARALLKHWYKMQGKEGEDIGIFKAYRTTDGEVVKTTVGKASMKKRGNRGTSVQNELSRSRITKLRRVLHDDAGGEGDERDGGAEEAPSRITNDRTDHENIEECEEDEDREDEDGQDSQVDGDDQTNRDHCDPDADTDTDPDHDAGTDTDADANADADADADADGRTKAHTMPWMTQGRERCAEKAPHVKKSLRGRPKIVNHSSASTVQKPPLTAAEITKILSPPTKGARTTRRPIPTPLHRGAKTPRIKHNEKSKSSTAPLSEVESSVSDVPRVTRTLRSKHVDQGRINAAPCRQSKKVHYAENAPQVHTPMETAQKSSKKNISEKHSDPPGRSTRSSSKRVGDLTPKVVLAKRQKKS